MIVDMRTYTLKPNRGPEYIDLMKAEGLEFLAPIRDRLLGYFQTEVGPLNQVVHLWGYESFEQRLELRAQVRERLDDARFRDLPDRLLPLVERMENRLLLPVDFSPIR